MAPRLVLLALLPVPPAARTLRRGPPSGPISGAELTGAPYNLCSTQLIPCSFTTDTFFILLYLMHTRTCDSSVQRSPRRQTRFQIIMRFQSISLQRRSSQERRCRCDQKHKCKHKQKHKIRWRLRLRTCEILTVWHSVAQRLVIALFNHCCC